MARQYEQGKLDDAVDRCRRALEIDPDDAEAHNALGGALNDVGRLDQAVACFRRVLELKPHFAEAHQNLGGALAAQGDLEEGVEHFHIAIALTRPSAATNVAITLRVMARRHAERDDYNHARTVRRC